MKLNNVRGRLSHINSDSIFGGDKVVWMVLFLLSAISIVEVYSAASSLAYKSGDYWAPGMSHLLHIAVGWACAIVVCRIPCQLFKMVPIIGIPVVVGLLLYTMVAGAEVNGASRWVGGFQPSEIAKGVLVITTALILSISYRKDENKTSMRGMKFCLGIAAVICALILPENLSTAVLTGAVVMMLMFVGRSDWRWLGAIAGSAILVGGLGYAFLAYTPADTLHTIGEKVPMLHRVETWGSRIKASQQEEVDAAHVDLGQNTQMKHAKIAVATCGVVGRGPGNSVSRDYLPQAYADFIFAIIIEELGLFGGIIVVMLYLALLYRAGIIASRCERRFPALLCMGLALLIVVQAMINICVCVDLFPVTGQQLPLVSRGGTGIIFNCIYVGIILSVSRTARQVGMEQLALNTVEDNEGNS